MLCTEQLGRLAGRQTLTDCWHFVACAALAMCNRPEQCAQVYESALKKSQNRLLLTRQTRDALLKSAALGGLPKSINALTSLLQVTPQELRDQEVIRGKEVNVAKTVEPLKKAVDTESANQSAQKGSIFFDQVYGKVADRVRAQMCSAYPDLEWYALRHVYAPLLAYTGVLSPAHTSLVVIACLVPQNVSPQLKGHLKGALNTGAALAQVRETRDMAMEIAGWCDQRLDHVPGI